MDSYADVSEKRPASPAIAPQPDVQNGPREHTASPASHANTPGDTVPQLPPQDSGDDVAPPKPPRPANPLQQAEDTLKEAFPSIDSSVVRAVLRASGGNVEPAFNALLGLSTHSSSNDPVMLTRAQRCPTRTHRRTKQYLRLSRHDGPQHPQPQHNVN